MRGEYLRGREEEKEGDRREEGEGGKEGGRILIKPVGLTTRPAI